MSYLGSRRHIPVWIGIGKLQFFRKSVYPLGSIHICTLHIYKNLLYRFYISAMQLLFFLFLVGIYVNLSLKVNFSLIYVCFCLLIECVWMAGFWTSRGWLYAFNFLVYMYNEKNKYFIWFIFDAKLYLYNSMVSNSIFLQRLFYSRVLWPCVFHFLSFNIYYLVYKLRYCKKVDDWRPSGNFAPPRLASWILGFWHYLKTL